MNTNDASCITNVMNFSLERCGATASYLQKFKNSGRVSEARTVMSASSEDKRHGQERLPLSRHTHTFPLHTCLFSLSAMTGTVFLLHIVFDVHSFPAHTGHTAVLFIYFLSSKSHPQRSSHPPPPQPPPSLPSHPRLITLTAISPIRPPAYIPHEHTHARALRSR